MKEDMLVSMSLCCWFETEVLPIPFRERAQTHSFLLSSLTNVLYKLEVFELTEFEFQIEGFFPKAVFHFHFEVDEEIREECELQN